MISHTIAKSDDGTIQITFSIPFATIKNEQEKIIEEESEKIIVPGFRKGMAPKDKAAEKVSEEDLIQKSLAKILPSALAEVITKEKLALAIYPRLELVSAKENEAWQIKATSCELPTIELGDYKKRPSKKIEDKEKEAFVIKQVLTTTQAKIPKLLIDEDVNNRLASLLQRTEHLGLSLEDYLKSIGKTPATLRSEYQRQAEEAIILELALNKIADQEKIEVEKTKIDQAIKAASADPKLAEELQKPEKQKIIASVLRRQEVISYLKNQL